MSNTTNTGASAATDFALNSANSTGTTTGTATTAPATPLTTGTCPPGTAPGGVFGAIAPMLLILLAFYFLLMRPQQKREAKRREMVNAIKRGDKVLTNSGIIGVVHKVIGEREISLEVSEGVRIKILKSFISDILDRNSKLNELEADLPEIKGEKVSSNNAKDFGKNEEKSELSNESDEASESEKNENLRDSKKVSHEAINIKKKNDKIEKNTSKPKTQNARKR